MQCQLKEKEAEMDEYEKWIMELNKWKEALKEFPGKA